ncbi:MAG: GNAT family N-acetyltransferase [Bacteroidetes bacterium]|nr:GNAT family N-acetyltransferase [Bacteroidota bacterium]
MHAWAVHTLSLSKHPALWEQLRSDAPEATIFSGSEWIAALGEAFERQTLGMVLSFGDTPVLGMPLFLARRGPLRVSTPLPITLYAGLLRTGEYNQELARLLEAAERKLHFISISSSMTTEECSIFSTRKWHLYPRQSFRIDINDVEALWNGYSQSLRRKLRRIPDDLLLVNNAPKTSSLVRMYEQSYERHGIRPPIPGDKMHQWIQGLRSRGLLHCFSASVPDGRLAATRILVRDGKMLYDWLAGTDPTVASSASHWLLHRLLLQFSASGCTQFDFMGANTPGISDFKRSFGGHEHEYWEAEWFRPSFLKKISALRNSVIRSRRRTE